MEGAVELQLDEAFDDDQEVVTVQSDNRTIHAKPGDVEVGSLYNKAKRGELLVQPDFQRDFVWTLSERAA